MLSHQKLKKRTHHVARYVRIGNQYINNDIIRLINIQFRSKNTLMVLLDDKKIDSMFFSKRKGNKIDVLYEYEYEYRYEEICIIGNIPYIAQYKNINIVKYGKRNHYKFKYRIKPYPYKIIDVLNSEMFKQHLINAIMDQ